MLKNYVECSNIWFSVWGGGLAMFFFWNFAPLGILHRPRYASDLIGQTKHCFAHHIKVFAIFINAAALRQAGKMNRWQRINQSA